MQYTSQDAAVLIASCVGVVLSNTLSLPDLESWGWRIAFLAGVVIVPFGIMIRKSLPETLHAATMRHWRPTRRLARSRCTCG